YRRALEGRRVLVVENEWLIAEELCRVLTNEGAHVIGPAASMDQALALIAECKVDAAVLDIHLGNGPNVYSLAELLQAREVPFIFATGYEALCIRPDFASVPHLIKPFVPSMISRILAETSDVARRQHA
ncbi:MAG: response regulator, partial [Cytophagaceae bacterium]